MDKNVKYIKCGKCGAKTNIVDSNGLIGITCEKCIFKMAGVSKSKLEQGLKH